jgi:hypothetical protein
MMKMIIMNMNTNRRLASGIGVYFEKEIENALRAVDEANNDIAKVINTREMDIYRKGFSAAIDAVAVTFGLNYRSGTGL